MNFNTMCVLVLLVIFSSHVCRVKSHRHKKLQHDKHDKHDNHDIAFCFKDDVLNNLPSNILDRFVGHKMRWDKYTAVYMVPHLEDIERRRRRRKRNPAPTCPENNLTSGKALHERSISPWSYRIDVDENRYPQKLAFAQCLCEHCINANSGKQNASLNSVVITQTMLVLRKKTCPHDPTLSTFNLEYLSVPVGCTCAVPLLSY